VVDKEAAGGLARAAAGARELARAGAQVAAGAVATTPRLAPVATASAQSAAKRYRTWLVNAASTRSARIAEPAWCGSNPHLLGFASNPLLHETTRL